MVIGKTTSPTPGTTLHPGQTVSVTFEVDYTLAPSDDASRAKLGLLTFVLSSTDSVSYDAVLVSPPAAPPVLPASASALPQTLTFTVPTASRLISIVAFIDTLPQWSSVTPLRPLRFQSWPVK